jgi:hypothetical protein
MRLHMQINKLEPPRSASLDYLRTWLGQTEGGNNFLEGAAVEGEVWDKPDLVSLCVNGVEMEREMDPLTKWIYDLMPWFHRHLGYRIMVLP